MPEKKAQGFQLAVFIAYGFYLLLGLSWFIIALLNGGHFNTIALGMTILFGAQYYYRHLITNLVLGIILLFMSIFMLLQSINGAVAASRAGNLLFFDKFLIGMSVTSIIMSGILIFSYIRLGFKD